MNIEFYYSKEEDNLIEVLNSNGKINIAGYEKLVANTIDAAKEKHVPVIKLEDDNVLFIQVGEVLHPMTKEHLISKIYAVTDKGDVYKKVLDFEDTPEFTIDVSGAKKVDVYSYCNMHGLWKSSVEL